eukprot:435555-Hanusia_phi.AAC.1
MSLSSASSRHVFTSNSRFIIGPSTNPRPVSSTCLEENVVKSLSRIGRERKHSHADIESCRGVGDERDSQDRLKDTEDRSAQLEGQSVAHAISSPRRITGTASNPEDRSMEDNVFKRFHKLDQGVAVQHSALFAIP